jgi:hypothetical protein
MVIVIEPLLPSLVAVIFGVPLPTAVTTPTGDTVASDVLDEVQPMVRPVSTLPAESLSVTASCVD